MFKTPLPWKYRTFTAAPGDCMLCDEPGAAHAVWTAINGEVPKGKVVSHKAQRTDRCINPAHLRLIHKSQQGKPSRATGRPLSEPKPKPVPTIPTGPRGVRTMVPWGDGERSLSELAREHGISVDCARNRLKNGWSVERALTTPKGPLGRPKSAS